MPLEMIRPGRNVYIKVHNNPTAKDTIFLIHGLGGRGAQWREQIKVLKNEYSLIVPDLLGHDQSEKPITGKANPYTFLELEKDLNIIFNKYASECNIIMGHSYGGALAASLALANQDRVDKLVLITPAELSANIPVPFIFRMPIWVMELLRPLLEKEFKKMVFTKNASPELIKQEMDAANKNQMEITAALIKGMKTIPPIDIRNLHVPTLMILAAQDKLVPASQSMKCYESIPKLQIEMIENSSHLILLENYQIVNELIWRFLGGVTGR